MSLRILIAGCGDVGTGVAALLARGGHEVTGLRRTAVAMPPGVTCLCADLTAPATLAPLAGAWDVVVYAPTPAERGEAAYRAVFEHGLAHLFSVLRARRLLFVSSTAVYGQDDGTWVDEDTVVAPQAFNGAVLVRAEELARTLAPEPVAVRLGGIYGPGREWLIRSARAAAGQPLTARPVHWTNRIHRDDAAALIAHLATLGDPQVAYNGVDDSPAARFEVLSWLARQLGLAAPVPVTEAGPDTGKRVRNGRLRRTGLLLRYPDYRAGYRALLVPREGA